MSEKQCIFVNLNPISPISIHKSKIQISQKIRGVICLTFRFDFNKKKKLFITCQK